MFIPSSGGTMPEYLSRAGERGGFSLSSSRYMNRELFSVSLGKDTDNSNRRDPRDPSIQSHCAGATPIRILTSEIKNFLFKGELMAPQAEVTTEADSHSPSRSLLAKSLENESSFFEKNKINPGEKEKISLDVK
jgi:hypothetical protein